MNNITGDLDEFKQFLIINEELGFIVGGQQDLHSDDIWGIFKKNEITSIHEVDENTYLGLGINNLMIEAM